MRRIVRDKIRVSVLMRQMFMFRVSGRISLSLSLTLELRLVL